MAGTAARPNSRNVAAAGRKPSRAAATRAGARPTVLGRVFARPGMIVAGATFAAVMTGIVANALLFQKGHHPSPLFSPVPAEATAPTPMLAPQALAPQPAVPAPASRQAVEEPAPAPAVDAPVAKNAGTATTHKSAAKPAHAASVPAAKPAHKPAATAHRDTIGDLLAKQGH